MSSERPPFFLVWNPQGRAPVYQHHNLESAEREARRLAVECPGQRFFVLIPASVTQHQAVTTQRFEIDMDAGIPF